MVSTLIEQAAVDAFFQPLRDSSPPTGCDGRPVSSEAEAKPPDTSITLLADLKFAAERDRLSVLLFPEERDRAVDGDPKQQFSLDRLIVLPGRPVQRDS